MVRRISVGQRLADDLDKKGIDALFGTTSVQHPTRVPAKKFEKATFYFDPSDLVQLEKAWLRLMEQGIRCNKSEIVSILLKMGLDEHENDPTNSTLRQHLTGKRRRS